MKKIDYSSMFTLRKDGRYVGTYTDDTGRHYIYDKDPALLYDKLQKITSPGPVLFKTIAEAWHDKHWEKIKDGTKACYDSFYKQAVEEYGDREASSISASDVYNHLIRLNSQGYSAKSVKTLRTIYKKIFENAIIDENFGREIRYNPAVQAPLPDSLKRGESRFAPEDDIVDRIRAEAPNTTFGLYAVFIMSTGFRRGEALAVQWQDIDFKAKTITCSKALSYRGAAKISTPKTSSGIRVVPLLPDLAAVLKMPPDAKKTDFVFHGEDPTKPMAESTYKRNWLRFCKALGFAESRIEKRVSAKGRIYFVEKHKPTLTAHHFRHGYATLLFDAGVDVHTARLLLGHAHVETTLAIYTHLRQRKQKESLSKLENYVTAAM